MHAYLFGTLQHNILSCAYSTTAIDYSCLYADLVGGLGEVGEEGEPGSSSSKAERALVTERISASAN
jgi:hypothetical protein